MATITFYNNWKEAQFGGVSVLTDTPIDFDTDVIKLALCTSTYTPSATGDQYFTDAGISSNQVSGTNYTAGGSTMTVSVAETGGTVTVDMSDVTWAQSGTGFNNARYAVAYKDATTDPLIFYIDFTTNKGNDTGDLTVRFNASGAFTVT